MKSLLKVDASSGRITCSDDVLVFDPSIGAGSVRIDSTRVLFEGIAEGNVRVVVSYIEVNGGILSLFADHPRFGKSWDDWSEQKERSRMAWLAEFLKVCGSPVGSYPWGKVEVLHDKKGGQGLAIVSYAARRSAARDRVRELGA